MTEKYIEFTLPNGSGGMAAGYTKMAIMRQLTKVCEQLNIVQRRDFVTVTKPYRLRVQFYSEEHLTLFALAWNPKHSYAKFTVRDDDINSDITRKI